jgi:molecular chaperone DnaK (HSP70)
MYVLGIDFGTTYSSVWTFTEKGDPQLISDDGRIGVPSVVAYQFGEWIVGSVAVERAGRFPKTTIYDLKRFLGCSYDMRAIQEAIRRLPFPVFPGPNGEILIEIEETTGFRQYHPWELVAKIFAKLKRMAEAVLGPVTKAVISVPANFTRPQREDTTKAANLAGLTVLQLVNEPSAGAIAYQWKKQSEQQKTVLVFDLGGGTLDVTILTVQRTTFTVEASFGDSHFGGRDFDVKLMELCLERFDPSGSLTLQALPHTNPKAYHTLRERCEQAKCRLSEANRQLVSVDDFLPGRHMDIIVTRAEFEAKCQDLFARILPPVEEVMRNADKTARDIDEVILIGGSSKIPEVRRILATYFGKKPFSGVSPLAAVATGATIFAGLLKTNQCGIPTIKELPFRDICPLPLGIRGLGDRMLCIIPANTAFPVERSIQCGTEANQTSIKFEIFEGPWLMTRRNRCLGSFTLSEIPAAEAGKEFVRISFKVDCDGVLIASARVLSNGTTARLTVTTTAHLFSRQRVLRIIAERDAHKASDEREYEEAGRRVRH